VLAGPISSGTWTPGRSSPIKAIVGRRLLRRILGESKKDKSILAGLRHRTLSAILYLGVPYKAPMPQTPNSKPSPWQAESFRLSVFLAPNVQPRDEGWWARVTGADPENKTSKPTRGEFSESGIFQGNLLSLAVQPGRIDWIMGPNLAMDDDPDVGLRLVGSFEVVEKTFVSIMTHWLESCPSITRLAYGATLLEPVESKESGYRRIAEYLPAIKIDPGSSDLFYQINRPRESQVIRSNFLLNRLSKWSVSSFQAVRIAVAAMVNQRIQPSIHSHGGAPVMACRLELDLSTPAGTQNELPHDTLPHIFSELVALGSEIAQKGDIA
jgi:hypothetical protein